MQKSVTHDLTREVLATADVFLRESLRLFRPYGLTAAQYNVLNVLAGSEAGLSQRELGDVLVVDRSNVTGLLDRMEKSGWVRRSDDPTDRRVFRVTLTPKGMSLWAKVSERHDQVMEQISRAIDHKQAKVALLVMKQLQSGARSWVLSAD